MVARAKEYLAFDEWWGEKLTEHMPYVVQRELAAGRLRAHVAAPHRDLKVWLQDDFVYNESLSGSSGGGSSSNGSGSSGGSSTSTSSTSTRNSSADWSSHVRWYDTTLLLTWRLGSDGVGRLWSGEGTDAVGTLWDGRQSQRAIVHLMASKNRTALRGLVAYAAQRHRTASLSPKDAATADDAVTADDAATADVPLPYPSNCHTHRTDHMRRLASRAHEIVISAHGMWIKGSKEGRMHAWYSGEWPGSHCQVRSSDLAASARAIARLGKPKHERHFARRVRQLLPCVASVRRDANNNNNNEDHDDDDGKPVKGAAGDRAGDAVAGGVSALLRPPPASIDVETWARGHGLRACPSHAPASSSLPVKGARSHALRTT